MTPATSLLKKICSQVSPPSVVRVADGCHVDDVGDGGMHANPRDGHGGLEPEVGPGGPSVHGLVDAVSPGHAVALVGLAHADVHDVRIRGIEGDGAHRAHLELAVTDRQPVLTGILGLPQTTGGHAEPEDLIVGRVAHHRGAPPTYRRTHVAPFEGLEFGTRVCRDGWAR
jgi:hypothetical protein